MLSPGDGAAAGTNLPKATNAPSVQFTKAGAFEKRDVRESGLFLVALAHLGGVGLQGVGHAVDARQVDERPDWHVAAKGFRGETYLAGGDAERRCARARRIMCEPAFP